MTASLNTARAQLSAGNFDACRRIAGEALEKTPDDVAVWDLLVDIEMAQNHWHKALEKAREALARWPDHMGLRLNEALTLMHTGRATDAHKAIEKWEGDFPFRPLEGALLQTIWQVRFGSLKRAKYHRRRFEEIAPDSPHIAMLDAMIAGKADDMLGKERASRLMTEDTPMDASAHARLAYAQFDLFKLGAARKSARTALSMEPTKRRVEAILWLSWIVFLPPFFASHLHDWLNGMRKSMLPRALAAAVKLPFELVFFLGLVLWAYPTFIKPWAPPSTGLLCILLFVLWPIVRNGMLDWFGRRSERVQDVELKGY